MKRGYTLLDRKVLCYVCLFLCVWLFTRKGAQTSWILKFSECLRCRRPGVPSLGQEGLLEKDMATRCRTQL